tara:strand:+ start:24387 stop:24674 length:288 start_codon:yes stop_codon:yes gene_type:complete
MKKLLEEWRLFERSGGEEHAQYTRYQPDVIDTRPQQDMTMDNVEGIKGQLLDELTKMYNTEDDIPIDKQQLLARISDDIQLLLQQYGDEEQMDVS